MEILNNSARLARDFTPTRFPGNLLLFTAAESSTEDVLTPEAWRPCVEGEIEAHDITGTHEQMMQPDPVAQIGVILAAKLDEINKSIPSPSPSPSPQEN